MKSSVFCRDKIKPSKNGTEKISLGDAILPTDQCVASFGFLTWSYFLITILFWILRVIKVLYHMFQYWDIKAFYNSALKIEDVSIFFLSLHLCLNVAVPFELQKLKISIYIGETIIQSKIGVNYDA